MEKCNKKLMDVNKETAMRLWRNSFGKEIEVEDFAGRKMMKGAYNDRNSDYGWNVDHILPQSRGGVTADYNLICCHILTNDEKADKFPCFTANNRKFEIIKVQNHYEIRELKTDDQFDEVEEDDINFYDSAAGVRYFKDLTGIQNKKMFVGSILISLKNVKNTALIDFIEEIFCSENIIFESNGIDNRNIKIYLIDYDLPLKEDIANLFDKCVLVNTYLSHYFKPLKYIESYDIYYRVDYFKEKRDLYSFKYGFYENYSQQNTLYINDLVIANTEAKLKLEKESPQNNILSIYGVKKEWTTYNYVYGTLSKNLDKEVNGK